MLSGTATSTCTVVVPSLTFPKSALMAMSSFVNWLITSSSPCKVTLTFFVTSCTSKSLLKSLRDTSEASYSNVLVISFLIRTFTVIVDSPLTDNPFGNLPVTSIFCVTSPLASDTSISSCISNDSMLSRDSSLP